MSTPFIAVELKTLRFRELVKSLSFHFKQQPTSFERSLRYLLNAVNRLFRFEFQQIL